MLYLVGTLQNAFTSPSGTRKDGTAYPAMGRLQVLEKETLEGGDSRFKLHDLSCEPQMILDYIKTVGKSHVFPVRVYKDNLYLSGKGSTVDAFQIAL